MVMPERQVVRVRGVWKIFGGRAEEAFQAIQRDNRQKAEVLERFRAVVAVRDASFTVERGKSFASWACPGRASLPWSVTSTA